MAEAVSLKEVKKENIANFILINIINLLVFLDIYWQIMARHLIISWWQKHVIFLASNNTIPLCIMSLLTALPKHSIRHFTISWRKLSLNLREIGMKEWKKLFGNIWPLITCQHKQLLILLFMELRRSFHLSIKFYHCGLLFKKGSLMKKMLNYASKNWRLLRKKRLEAQQSLECYQARLARSFNEKVHLRCFQIGNQFLVVRRPIITSHWSRSKFSAKWNGSYIVQEVYSNGTYKLVDS